ncbi:MAG: tetratricopeptide repeat protein [Clostridiales bacterium]|nr:tetratricopeptide repeat protein [Clostridiales bacterium]
MEARQKHGRTYALSSTSSKVAAVLLVLIALNAALLAWRWASEANLPPGSYHEFHISEWQQASIARPDDPIVWSTLGGLYAAAGQPSKARAAFTRAVELDHRNSAAQMYLAEVDMQNEDYESARTRLLIAAEALPDGGAHLAYYRLGELEEATGDFEKALEHYEASISQSSTYWNAHFRVAVLHERAGRESEALESAQRAARLVPDNDEVREMLSRLRTTP